jgi:hypothetical protein
MENKEKESKILQKLTEIHNQEINMRKVTVDFGGKTGNSFKTQ